MGLADMALMLQAERDRERQEADRQTRLAQERLKAQHAAEARVAELEAALRQIASIPAITPRGEGRDRVSIVTSGRRYIEIAEAVLKPLEAKGDEAK